MAATEPPSSPPSTGRQAAWNYLVFALSKSSTLLMTVVVARILDPTEFGLFALALLVVNIFEYVKDLGVGAALVQSRRDWSMLAPTGLTLSVIFGVLASAVLAATADLTAGALKHPDLAPMIRVLAIALALNALSTVPAAWLRRSMNFRARILPEFAGAVAKTGLTIGLAFGGFGVWSLVYGQLAATAVMTPLYWLAAGRAPRFGLDRALGGELLRFGMPVTAVTLLAYAIYNVDYLAVGTRLGADDLGLYTLAYRLPELLVLNLCVVVSDVLFSALSGLQHDREGLGNHYLRALPVVMALTAPIGIGMAVAAGPLVQTLYGDQYAGSAPILAVLALYTVIYSASFHAGDVFKAIGRPGVLTAVSAAKLIVVIGPIWWAAGYNAVMVAWALLATEVVHFIIRMAALHRVMTFRWTDLTRALLGPVLAAAGMGLGAWGLSRVTEGLVAPLELALLAVAGAVLYLALLRLTAPQLFAAGVRLVRSRVGAPQVTAPAKPKEGP
ncbi:MAG: lipopolysaccharide biosynthesis protein [Mycobacterium sp.]